MELQSKALDYIVAPHEICASCNTHSGPKFYLSKLKDFSPMLRRTTIPTGHEREMVEKEIASVQSEISELDIEMERLQASMNKLARRRAELRWVEKQGKGLFSPVRRLPGELLRAIFYQPQLRSEIHLGWERETDFIRTATHVCYYWSCIAQSCAELWSNLEVNAWSMRDARAPPASAYIEKCITLSKEVPLKLCIHNSCTPGILGERCVKILAQNAYRWEHIDIRNGNLLQAIHKCLPEDAVFTQLRSLDLGGNFDDVSCTLKAAPRLAKFRISHWNRDHNPYSLSFSSMPSLAQIEISSGVTHPSTYLLNFPWSQITEAKIHPKDFAHGELHRVLQDMSNLSSLTLQSEPKDESWPIVLPTLQELNLNENAFRNGIENITVPHLKALRVHPDFKFATNSGSTMINFFQRSACKLEELELHKSKVRDDDSWSWHSVESWLNLPEVKSIKKFLWVEPPSWSMLSGMQWLAENLPELEILDIQRLPVVVTKSDDQEYRSDYRCTKELIAMLKSRLTASQTNRYTGSTTSTFMHPMKTINIDLCLRFADSGYLRKDEIRDLKEFIESDLVRQSGVDIVITPLEEEQEERSIYF